MMVPYGDRSGVVIEPWLMDQWFVDAKTLAEPAIKAVEEAGCKVERVLAILDRNQGGSEELRNRGYDFRVLLEADGSGKVRVVE